LDPTRWRHWAARADSYARLGQWESAAENYRKAVELGCDDLEIRHAQALVQLKQGDLAHYRSACRQLLEHYRRKPDSHTAHRLAWTCALGSQSTSDLQRVVHLAESATSPSSQDYEALTVLGAILFRAGDQKLAVQRLNEALALPFPAEYTVEARLFLAMAYHGLGDTAEANRSLAEATKRSEDSRDTGYDDRDWKRRLEREILQSEALHLVVPKP
jgi:Flp pilus assembly protein TadD